MKSYVNILVGTSLLFSCGVFLPLLTAQDLERLHSFSGGDGANPHAGLVFSDGMLYGTTLSGGTGSGTVFALNTNGIGFRTIHQFSPGGWPYYTNSDGDALFGGVILSGNNLYGAATYAGSYGNGTIFSVNTDGTNFRNLHNFTNNDGANPSRSLLLWYGKLYGTAANRGDGNNGTLFALNIDGTGFRIFHTFTAGVIDSSSNVETNSDGARPWGELIPSDNTLYGTASSGGSHGNGTAFSVHTDGTSFTVLHNFSTLTGVGTNSDGANPITGLTLAGNSLYGTASSGGSYGDGTIFSMHTDGTGFTTLHHFTSLPPPSYTNSDGAQPQSQLIISGNTIFGTARLGGRSGQGTVFAMNTDGTDFKTLHHFSLPSLSTPHTNIDGSEPSGKLVLFDGVLYGTTRYGGSYSGNNDPSANGTIFRISLPASPPLLTLTASGTNLLLFWPTNCAGLDSSGYTLQSTTNLNSQIWTTNFAAPEVINEKYTVIAPISSGPQFFRLSK